MKYSLGKDEKLKRKKLWEALFEKGNAFSAYPIRMVSLAFDSKNFESIENLPTKSQIAVAAPKKKFKNATDRNRIKRQMRESYRLNKHILKNNHAILFIYLPREKKSYAEIDEGVKKCLAYLNETS